MFFLAKSKKVLKKISAEKKIVPADFHKKRLDDAVAALFLISKSAAKKAIAEKRILKNKNFPKKAGEKVSENDEIVFQKPEKKEQKMCSNLPPPKILFENDDFLIAEKPAGIATHFDQNHADCLVARLLAAGKTLSPVGAPDRPGVVHRLDKDTSGILIFAKNEKSHFSFQNLFANRKIKKTYLARVFGAKIPDAGTIDSPIGRDARDRQKMTVLPENVGKNARTHFSVISRGKTSALLKIDLETGRTHQIRVHLAAIGHPVVGDKKYGDAKKDAKRKSPRLFLHAEKLEFWDPTGIFRRFHIPAPESFFEDF